MLKNSKRCAWPSRPNPLYTGLDSQHEAILSLSCVPVSSMFSFVLFPLSSPLPTVEKKQQQLHSSFSISFCESLQPSDVFGTHSVFLTRGILLRSICSQNVTGVLIQVNQMITLYLERSFSTLKIEKSTDWVLSKRIIKF